MSSVYKKFTAQDYAVVPFNAHKQYNFSYSDLSSNSLSIFEDSKEKRILENLTTFSLERSF